MTWPKVSFTQALQDVSSGNTKVPKTDFHRSGTLPVVDQGQGNIAGYVDDPTLAQRHVLPVIVFGDHTRCFKYVDFPFAVGADGVKLLTAKEGFDAKYLFWFLKSLHIPNFGYSRHYKFLKEISVPKPPLEEQKRIATVLDQADALRAKRREAIALLDALAQSILTHSFKGEDYPKEQLSEVVREGTIVTYGIVQAGAEFESGVPYIRTGDLRGGEIVTDGLRHTNPSIAAKFARSRVDAGDIVMSIRATVGTTALVPAELDGANLTQGTARIAPGSKVTREYLLAYLRCHAAQSWIQRQVKGATFREITLGKLRELEVPLPPLTQQVEFSQHVRAVETQLATQRAHFATLDELFASLQQRAFSGTLWDHEATGDAA